MPNTKPHPADASPECFLVAADTLVQNVLKRYRPENDKKEMLVGQQENQAVTAVA